jgi:hypothetical protein
MNLVLTPAKSAYHRLLALMIIFLMNCGVFNHWNRLRWVGWTSKFGRKVFLWPKSLVWILHVIPSTCPFAVRANNIFTFWVATICYSWKQIAASLLCSLYPRMSVAHVRYNSELTSRELVWDIYIQKCGTGDRHREFLPHPDATLSCWVAPSTVLGCSPYLKPSCCPKWLLWECSPTARSSVATEIAQRTYKQLTYISVVYVKYL